VSARTTIDVAQDALRNAHTARAALTSARWRREHAVAEAAIYDLLINARLEWLLKVRTPIDLSRVKATVDALLHKGVPPTASLAATVATAWHLEYVV
jgi:hypothetical protein